MSDDTVGCASRRGTSPEPLVPELMGYIRDKNPECATSVIIAASIGRPTSCRQCSLALTTRNACQSPA